jgi:hypothetical protein
MQAALAHSITFYMAHLHWQASFSLSLPNSPAGTSGDGLSHDLLATKSWPQDPLQEENKTLRFRCQVWSAGRNVEIESKLLV